MNKKEWNQIVRSFPETQLLQLWEWGEVKEKYGWKSSQYEWENNGEVIGAAQVLERVVSIPVFGSMKMLYVPKGPLMVDWSDENSRKIVFDGLRAVANERNAFLLKIEPEVIVGFGEGSEKSKTSYDVMIELKNDGWRYSNEQIQFKNSVLIDLSKSEEELLAGMKQKTRYNVRLATKKGVIVRVGKANDFESIFKIYAETAIRDGFAIREKDYYLTVWEKFYKSGNLSPLIAEVEGEMVSALMLFHSGEKSWYVYGMSSAQHRNKMPTYLLQWEAIKLSKQKGCRVYDMWGAPVDFSEKDPLWGVYRVKKGFGGQVQRTIGSYDLPLKPFYYWLYSRLWPRVMDLIRFFGRKKTKQESSI